MRSIACLSTRLIVLATGCLASLIACSDASEPSAPKQELQPENVASVQQPLVRAFAAGSLIIPMDTTYQNAGTLKAFGLLDRLLRAGVPVSWAIKAAKTQGAADFIASGTNLQTGATITNHGYRAGPFIIDSADRAAALPIITAWQLTNVTAVHDMSAFSADVRKTLAAAPRLAVFVDGNEDIAFRYLNAAGIQDSTGKAWPNGRLNNYAAYPDVLQPAAIRGPVIGGAADGALNRADGTPAYCQVTSMHYASPADEEVVREVRLWLNSPLTHAFMECHATTAFENALNGRFLTTNGLIKDGNTPSPLTNRIPDSPFAQYDGNITAVGGSVNSMGLPPGSAFYATDTTLLNLSSAATSARIMWLTGFLDGNVAKGKISYLAGHEYDTTLPISANARTNGTRLFLDSIFESNCADTLSQPKITLSKSAPAAVSTATLTYTLSYANSGTGIADNAVITDPIPAGTAFVSATGGGTLAGGNVTWNLGNLAAGAAGNVSFVVTLPADGAYTNQAALDYRVSLTPKKVTSNGVTTNKTTLPPFIDLSVIVTDSPDPVGSSGAVAYTVNVTNASAVPAPTGGSVMLTLPAGATFVSGTGTGWTCSLVGAAVTCTTPSFAVGAAPTLTITLTAPVGPATMTTTVSASSLFADPVPANNTVVVTTAVTAGPGPDGGTDAGSDAGALDTDGDGLPDFVERAIGTDPSDADSDDDGVPDGAELDYDKDTDGDGLINALDPDSDNDGLFDGTEMGLDCSNKGTNVARGRCIPDADKGATKTNPLDADTDKGGVKDGSEDANLNGTVDPGETDPTAGHGVDDATVIDTDKDGLSDALEKFLRSDPNDADSDDDGVPDGAEPNFSDDTDGDGLRNVLDADSDNDGLFDGTEMGLPCSNPATNVARGRCRADADNGATKTSPLLRDTDRGGASDGSEDSNLNGALDLGEQDPTVGHADDDDDTLDTDMDGLGDKLEATLGSNPNDADSDDDGLSDGSEPNPGLDQDGDGKINILDPDSDGDGLFDGTEAGRDCDDRGTDATKGQCIADADPKTTTAVLDPDTDHGSVSDGDEDVNHNGKVDPGERDPNTPADDKGMVGGGVDSGTTPTPTAGAAAVVDEGFLAGGGCKCSILPAPAGRTSSNGQMIAAIGALAVLVARRRSVRRSTPSDITKRVTASEKRAISPSNLK